MLSHCRQRSTAFRTRGNALGMLGFFAKSNLTCNPPLSHTTIDGIPVEGTGAAGAGAAAEGPPPSRSPSRS